MSDYELTERDRELVAGLASLGRWTEDQLIVIRRVLGDRDWTAKDAESFLRGLVQPARLLSGRTP